MNNRISEKPNPTSRLNGAGGLAATRSLSSGRPVGGEMFFLTAPFIEHYGVTRDLSFEDPVNRTNRLIYDFIAEGKPQTKWGGET